MIARIPRLQPVLIFFLNRIWICSGCSQIFDLSHPFKGTIINRYIVTSSYILISIHDHVLLYNSANKRLHFRHDSFTHQLYVSGLFGLIPWWWSLPNRNIFNIMSWHKYLRNTFVHYVGLVSRRPCSAHVYHWKAICTTHKQRWQKAMSLFRFNRV
jgi:hypothetical protein